MNTDGLQNALHDANKDRALIYLDIFREIRHRHGEQEAIDILRTAIEARGRAFGKSLKSFAPRNFRGLCDAFAYVPDGGAMFDPQEVRCDTEGLELKMRKCPLKEAWQSVGVTERELSLLLYCASAMDVGTMDEAGFELKIRTWQPGEDGCCSLKITERIK
ncbi:MAG: L-2-amino-thiazoline-4-carboxylic acid hydrolase [Arenicellales bacterium]